MCSSKIYLDAPNIGDAEKKYLNTAVDTGFVSTAGPYVNEFENIFGKYLHAENAVSIQSGTAALHMSLHELGVGTGDEVIIPALTFVATVNPVVYVGAEPVFADVDPETWTIDPEDIERKITPKTKAIIPVHLYGSPCNMDKIMEIAKKNNLFVVEDATESLGSKYKDKFAGTFGDLGGFSFNGNKTITTGGGGMIVGKCPDRMKHIKFLVNQARDERKGYYHPEIGFNHRMTNIEAAVGLAQMTKLDTFLGKKRRFNEIYRQELGILDYIKLQGQHEGADSSWWLTCGVFEEGIDVQEVQKQLMEKGIPTRRVFMPIVEFPPYKDRKKDRYINSYDIYEKGLCFPGSTLNSEESIFRVCEGIKSVF